MAKEVNKDMLDMVDEVFKDQDPAFLEEIAKINSEDLNNQQIPTFDPEEAKKLKAAGLRGKWIMLRPPQKKIIYATMFIIFIGIPLVVLSALGRLTPKFSFSEVPSIAYLADETLALDSTQQPIGLFSLENDDEFTLKTREMLVQLKSRNNKKTFARCVFEIGMASEEDRIFISKREKDIIDIISEVLTATTEAEFSGVEGKERIRRKVIVALNKKLEGKVKSLHYDQILFQ